MERINKFLISSNDLVKVINRGCRVCKETTGFKSVKGLTLCTNCKSVYIPTSELVLNELEKTNNNFSVYRSGNVNCEDDEFNVRTVKSGLVLRKSKHSTK